MPRYTVARRYAADHNGRRFGPWQPGEEVELDAVDAEWVERDSPGVLEAEEPRRQAKPPADRQPRSGRKRSG